MHASQAVHTSAREPAVHGRSSGATHRQQSRASTRKPWRMFMLVCCAGAQTPQDVDDLYESQQNNSLNGQQRDLQSSAAAEPVEATASPAGPSTGLIATLSSSPAAANMVDTSAAAPTAPASRTSKVTAAPQQAFPTAVGATRSLLDDDASEDISSPVHQASSSSSSTPVASASRLRALASISPTAAATELSGRSIKHASVTNTSVTNTNVAMAPTPPPPAPAAAKGAAHPSIGLKPVGVAPTVPLPSSAAAATMASSVDDVRGDTAAVRDGNANAVTYDVTAASTQQQRRSSTSSGNRSPAVPSSPRPASPFTSRQLQGLVAAELSQQRQLRQQQREDAATAAAGTAADNVAGEMTAAAAVDPMQLPAQPAGLYINTGRKSKAAAASAPAAAAAATVASGGDIISAGRKSLEQQQQERQFSLQQWNSELEAAAAAVASGNGEAPGRAHVARSELAVTPEDAAEVPPASPTHMTYYTTSRPPKTPPNSSSKVASSSTGVAGSSSSSSSSRSSFDFTRSGAFNVQDSAIHDFVSPLHSSNSAGPSSYHTAPGFVQTKASVVDPGRGRDQGSSSERFKGFDSAGFWALPARSQIITRSAASASAPTLAQHQNDGSSPFVHQQLTNRQQQQQQQLLDDWSSSSQQQQGEWSSSLQQQQQQQQADDWSSQQQQQMSQSEEAEDWDVLPVLLSPLRIPSHREKAVEEVEDLTPLSPKMSVVGVSNSVINNMLSEEGFPLVPTGDDQGVSDLFAGTPRATSYSGAFSSSFSNSYANPHMADTEVPDTPRRLRGLRSETGAVAASRHGGYWQQQQQQQPGTRRYSGTFQCSGSRSSRGTIRRPASSEQLRQPVRCTQQLATSSEEDEGTETAGGRHSSSVPLPPVRLSISSGTARGRRLYGHMATDSAAASGSSSLSNPEKSWPVITSDAVASSHSSTSKQPAVAGAVIAAPFSVVAGSTHPGSTVAVHPAATLAGQPASAVQPEENAVQPDTAAAAVTEITSTSSNASGPTGVSYSRLRDISRSNEFARAGDVPASADAGRSSTSNSLVDIDPRAGSSSASLYTSSANVGGSGALFSRSAWALLGRQPSSSGPVQTLVAACAPAGPRGDVGIV